MREFVETKLYDTEDTWPRIWSSGGFRRWLHPLQQGFRDPAQLGGGDFSWQCIALRRIEPTINSFQLQGLLTRLHEIFPTREFSCLPTGQW